MGNFWKNSDKILKNSDEFSGKNLKKSQLFWENLAEFWENHMAARIISGKTPRILQKISPLC